MLTGFRSWRTIVRALTGIVLAVLSACASHPTHFYTFDTVTESTMASHTTSPAYLVDLRSVKVPAAVAKSQLVVQVNAAQVKVLEDDRWASPLPDEIRKALLADVTSQADAPDGHGAGQAGGVPVYQLSVDVQRFESWPGSHSLIDAVWSVRASNRPETLTCHSVVRQPVSAGYDALVEGHRRALRNIAAQIGEGVREFSAKSRAIPIRFTGSPDRTGNAALSCPAWSDARGMDAPLLGVAQ